VSEFKRKNSLAQIWLYLSMEVARIGRSFGRPFLAPNPPFDPLKSQGRFARHPKLREPRRWSPVADEEQ
jgi:hypothetical protein